MDSTTYKSIKDSQRKRKTANSTIFNQIMRSNPNISEDDAQKISYGLEHFSTMERFAEKQSFPEIVKYSQKYFDIHSGYYCTFSDNYRLRKSGSLDGYLSDEELTKDLLFGFDAESNPFIRELAETYRKDNNVKLLVEAWMQNHVKNAQTRRSYKNILERGLFLTDSQMMEYWKTVLGGMYEKSERQSNTDE